MKILLLKRHVFKQEFEIAASREYLQLWNPSFCSDICIKNFYYYIYNYIEEEKIPSTVDLYENKKVVSSSIYTK